MTLWCYLTTQTTRQDGIGDFARDAMLDRDFPRRAKRFETIEDYLFRRGACANVIDSCRKACLELEGRER